jgi:preprotein translocase subunit SecE
MPTVKDNEKPMASTNVITSGGGSAEEPRRPQPAAERGGGGGGGFFTIYKPGQGYWTRLGTGIGVALIIAFTANFLWTQLRAMPLFMDAGRPRLGIIIGIVAGFVVASGALAWYVMNKPSNADFLIATDSEMKKVNWTSRKDLIGSTKVVILFMFLIAAFLFLVDIIFGYFFWFIRVLHTTPF